VTGAGPANRCPVALNPARLASSQHCLTCFNCVANCPDERASLKLRLRVPSAEPIELREPNLWESLFVASLLGMYAAVAHQSGALLHFPLPVKFFGLIAASTAAYLLVCAVAGPLAGTGFRNALTTFGYGLLPLEFATALIAFGDDTLEFLRIVQPAAVVLLTVGFVWSVALSASILLRVSRTPARAAAAAVPLALPLLCTLALWLHWYAGAYSTWLGL
jgi:ferredoxin